MREDTRELAARCGLYCGVCRLHQATREDDLAVLRRLARIYSRRLPELVPLTAEGLLCDGCQSKERSVLCQDCSIRECTQQRNLAGCHQCPDFPCSHINHFPVAVGKKVMMRAVPYRRSHGTDLWVRTEQYRYQCPECGKLLYRGVRECRYCNSKVDLD